jgi:hypothetical protein
VNERKHGLQFAGLLATPVPAIKDLPTSKFLLKSLRGKTDAMIASLSTVEGYCLAVIGWLDTSPWLTGDAPAISKLPDRWQDKVYAYIDDVLHFVPMQQLEQLRKEERPERPTERWKNGSDITQRLKSILVELRDRIDTRLESLSTAANESQGQAIHGRIKGRVPQSNSTRRSGRKKAEFTSQRAEFANPLVNKGLTWPEIFEQYKEAHPEDINATSDRIRGAHEREYQGK